MGCCYSTSRSSTPTLPSQETAPQSSHSQSSRHPIAGAPRALSQVFNSPLKPHYWAPKDRQWTQSALNQERQMFWDTAVTNRPEVWASLHLACDELVEISASLVKIWERVRDGPTVREVQQMEERVKNAQAIIDAAGITIPTGDLVDGVYDPFGGHYALPVWVVCNPDNLVSDAAGATKAGDVRPVPITGTADEDDIALLKSKGKDAIAEVETPKVPNITVKCRLTDGRQDVIVQIPKDAKVGVLSKKVAKVAEAKIRLAYLGKMLDPTRSLIDQGWQEGNVVSALVFPSN